MSIVRGIPILIVMVAAAVAGMAWAISSPIGSSPDEDYHLASIWCPPPAQDNGCVVTTIGNVRYVTTRAELVDAPLCYAYHPDQSGGCIYAVPADEMVQSFRFDSGVYPGGFYHVMHVFANGNPYAAVYRIRAANVAIAVVLGALLVLGAARPARRIIAYAVVSTFVPMGMFIIPAANPSSWALMGVAATAFALHSYWLAETRNRVVLNGILVAAGMALAASSRADAALYAILAAVGVTCLHYRSVRRHPVRLILPGLVAVVCLVAYRTSSQVAIALSGTGLGTEGVGSGLSLLFYNVLNSPVLVLGNEGLNSLGWLDTPMPPIVYVPMLVVCGALFMAGIGRLSWMKSLVAFGGMATVMAVPLYILQVSHLVVGQGVQPRYILPLLPIVSLALLTGYRPSQAVRLPPATAWAVWALASLANSMALMVNIRRYTTGLDGPQLPGASVEWWSTNKVGPMPTWILGSLCFAVAAWMIVRLSYGPDGVPAERGSEPAAIAPQVVVADQGVAAGEPVVTAATLVTGETMVTTHPATQEYRAPDPRTTGT